MRKIVIYITFVIFSILILNGCSKNPVEPDISFKAPKYVQEMPSHEVDETQNLGSIFAQRGNALFSDKKAMEVNDIVTVRIIESASASSSGSKKLAEDDSSAVTPAAFSYGGSDETMKKINGGLNSYLGIGAKWGSKSAYKGSGQSTRKEHFSTSITARIVKVLNNGNYFIEGRREMLINGEKQIIQVSGVVRAEDIDSTNTIYSTKIADAKILYKTEGDISKSTNKGWGSKIIDTIWPF